MPRKFRTPVIIFVLSALVLIGSVIWSDLAQDTYRSNALSFSSSRQSKASSAANQMRVANVLKYVGGATAGLGLVLTIVAAGKRES